jgi:hypothetical protein
MIKTNVICDICTLVMDKNIDPYYTIEITKGEITEHVGRRKEFHFCKECLQENLLTHLTSPL